ncbi:hypothetical protein FNV43_RR07446 [Rhamnella rubrinervis]|uniref:Uncharacterized protein n=1 Tax=Rhamnella rubrinervis TaxID=2594499 RepID=A0A8K0HET0_9ROSA|nr:hypothetical protein FNV43_RR07446 [Rhamnella rubrinervis]
MRRNRLVLQSLVMNENKMTDELVMALDESFQLLANDINGLFKPYGQYWEVLSTPTYLSYHEQYGQNGKNVQDEIYVASLNGQNRRNDDITDQNAATLGCCRCTGWSEAELIRQSSLSIIPQRGSSDVSGHWLRRSKSQSVGFISLIRRGHCGVLIRAHRGQIVTLFAFKVYVRFANFAGLESSFGGKGASVVVGVVSMAACKPLLIVIELAGISGFGGLHFYSLWLSLYFVLEVYGCPIGFGLRASLKKASFAEVVHGTSSQVSIIAVDSHSSLPVQKGNLVSVRLNDAAYQEHVALLAKCKSLFEKVPPKDGSHTDINTETGKSIWTTSEGDRTPSHHSTVPHQVTSWADAFGVSGDEPEDNDYAYDFGEDEWLPLQGVGSSKPSNEFDDTPYTGQQSNTMVMVPFESLSALTVAQQNLNLDALQLNVSKTIDKNLRNMVKRKPGQPKKV